jgi:hypothetical protein
MYRYISNVVESPTIVEYGSTANRNRNRNRNRNVSFVQLIVGVWKAMKHRDERVSVFVLKNNFEIAWPTNRKGIAGRARIFRGDATIRNTPKLGL